MSNIDVSRRKAIRMGLAAVGAGLATSSISLARQVCTTTPVQPEGPFYPVVDQVDKDTDLTSVQGRGQAALGEVIIVQGVVSDANCAPIEGALVEIWQACASGKYNHPNDPNTAPLDPNFQYWGRAISDSQGRYRFRTIIPGAYPADEGWVRPPHIHFKIQKRGYLDLITQMYFQGHELNDKDLILKRVKTELRKSVVRPLEKIDQLPHPVAIFDITLERP